MDRLPEQLTAQARHRYDEVRARSAGTLVAVDFDGVLAPIVEDPTAATIHPDGPAVLRQLADRVLLVAVVTGRPARQAVELGRLREVAEALPDGARIVVLGQYGNQRWDSTTDELTSAEPPPGLARFREELPDLLGAHDAAEAFVEDKELALAVHTRRLPEPQAAFDRINGPLTEAAARHALAVEPGRMVVEVRAPGMDKGQALRTLVDEVSAEAVVYAGDDLGDVPAFRAVEELRADGTAGFLVCSGSEEQRVLVDLADVVVEGPAGVLALLSGMF